VSKKYEIGIAALIVFCNIALLFLQGIFTIPEDLNATIFFGRLIFYQSLLNIFLSVLACFKRKFLIAGAFFFCFLLLFLLAASA